MKTKVLFVSNINPRTADSRVLFNLFCMYGIVKSIHVQFDAKTGWCQEFAFVEMDTEESCNKAIEGRNKKVFQGRELSVEFWDKEKHKMAFFDVWNHCVELLKLIIW